MSVAYFIIPERKVRGVDVGVNGKALARSNHLERLAHRAGVRPLGDFFTMSPEEAADFIEDAGGQVPTDALPGLTWYDADEGLTTVRGLLAQIAKHPGKTPDEAAIVGDLRDFEEVLTRLAARGIRWHLGIDA